MPLIETVGSGSARGFGLNSQSIRIYQQALPNTISNLAGWYQADNWTGSTWPDSSGNGRTVTDIYGSGNIVKSTSYSNEMGAKKSFTTLSANANAGMRFDQVFDLTANSYTLFHVARRYGNTSGGDSALRGRIFDGLSQNWLSGFWNGNAGVAYHEGEINTISVDTHGNNWVISTDQYNLYKSNGVNRTGAGGAGGPGNMTTNTLLTLHYGNYTQAAGTERSTWVCSEVIFYTRQLNSTEIQNVEGYLANKYGIEIAQ